MTRPHWIAIDWGTSNLRAYAMDETDGLIESAKSDMGMSMLTRDKFEPTLLNLISSWISDTPIDVIASGMVGAQQGWIEAPYRCVPCAAAGADLTKAPTLNPLLNVWIAPGVSQSDPPDVMRGEETQIAGFLSEKPEFDGVLCLPGTHTKWVRISAEEIVSFATYMTGEIFDLLSNHSVLRHTVATDDLPTEPFLEAVSDAISKPQHMASRLFALRAAALLEGLQPATARARLSGGRLGSELAGARPYWLGMEICIIGAPEVSKLYSTALSSQGAAVTIAPVEEATLRGLTAAYRYLEQHRSDL